MLIWKKEILKKKNYDLIKIQIDIFVSFKIPKN